MDTGDKSTKLYDTFFYFWPEQTNDSPLKFSSLSAKAKVLIFSFEAYHNLTFKKCLLAKK